MSRRKSRKNVALSELRVRFLEHVGEFSTGGNMLVMRKRLLLFWAGDALGDVGGIYVSVFSGPEVRVIQIYLRKRRKQKHPVWL